ncbi:MAG: ABC transporter ATP-binding protein [Acidobacteria bacterium]|nr:MAG: ABC transporter ATP-binding protein [Acidobacteriota bacterium]
MASGSPDAPAGRKTKDWMQLFVPLLRPFRKQLCWAALAMVLDAFLTVFRPWPLKVVIDRVLSHKPSRVPFLHAWLDSAPFSRMEILYGACAATLLIAVLTGVLTYYFTRTMGAVGQHFVFTIRRDLFAHLQRLSLRFHNCQRRGDLITRLTTDIQAIQDLIANGIIVLGSNAFLIAGMLVLMFWLNWQFALAALSVTPLLFWVVFRYTRRIRVAARQARANTGLLASLAQETLSSIQIVQGLAQEEQQDDRFRAQSRSGLQAYLESVRYQARVAPLVDVLAAVGLAIVMWLGATRVLAGVLTTGDLVIFFAYITNLYSPIKALARLSYTYSKASVGAERIAEVMRVRSEVRDRKRARPAPPLRGRIEFRDVSFEYETGRTVLSHINLAIAPGEKIAIVGATGTGKSTLVSLVPRFYDPSEGEVRIDGEDIRTYTLQSLREQISLVLQDQLLFRGTIRENIAFGRPGASDEEIAAAAVTANADEFIQRFPDGYETLVAERGTTLSGGQKQRIAIARAILRDAPILILDEPTTGLDAAAERTVMDALERAAARRTTLIIAHRLVTVRLADRIVVLDRGRIVEEGTHLELLARNGWYARLYRLQMSTEMEKALVSANRALALE